MPVRCRSGLARDGLKGIVLLQIDPNMDYK